MSDLQHQRIAELARELRLSAVPDFYSAIARELAVFIWAIARRVPPAAG